MDLGLSGKVVVVTGGAKGIGAAIVRGAVAEGMVAAIIDRDGAAAHELAAELAAAGHWVEVVVASLDSAEACAAAVLAVMERCGRIDALVNNAGVNDGVGLEHGTPTAFGHSLRRNLSHYYEMTHYALAALKASRGAVVNIASKVALTGQGGTSGYAAAKGAILALTREWAVELLPAGIRVNAVIPAEVMTPLYAQWLATHPDPEAKRRAIEARIPLGQRMTTADEIAAAVLFLLSGQSAHTTGQHVHVDGGYVHLDRTIT
jgi:L-fucose dehydrogenase